MKGSSTMMIVLLFTILSSVATAQEPTKPEATQFHVGVILDLDNIVGKMARTSITMAVEDFYAVHSNYSTSLVLHTRDAKQDNVDATFAALELIRDTKTEAIIGPQKSTQTIIISEIGNKSQVPVITFAATSPTLSSMNVPYFIRTAVNDTAQITTITSLIKAYGWRQVVPIYDDTDFGRGIIPYLADKLGEIDVRIPYHGLIPISCTEERIRNELLKLQTMQTRVFIVHMSSNRGSILFSNAKKLGMMNKGYVWIMTTGVTSMMGSFNSSVISTMTGAIGVRLYVPKTPELNQFITRWRKRFQQDYPQEMYNEPSIHALWAYDTIHALAIAVENVRFKSQTNAKPSMTSSNLNVFPNGPLLLEAFSKITFRGLSGNFDLVNGQLQYLAFEIINVAQQGIRSIGFWRQEKGFSKEVDVHNKENYSITPNDLNPVIWPGESVGVPKGWEIPVSGNKLRVGVIKSSNTEFMTVEIDPVKNTTKPSGYAVDVFEEAIRRLPYALLFEYELFADLSTSLSYNDFVKQVYLGNYDVAIGDITVRYDRMLYADFSIPYTDSGVAMIVPVKNAPKTTFIFLKPLTFGLWFGSTMFLIYTGIAIWYMEPKNSYSLNGRISGHFGAILNFSLFAYQVELKSIFSKIVAISSAGFLLVLTSSYTASLTSMLTIQQLQPTVTDIHDLIRNNNYVGYPRGSFVEDLLQQLSFEKSKIKGYNVDEFDEVLKNQSVVAVVDEVPYLKSFLAKHCNSYVMIPIYKSAGFGFAFSKGSPLVSDISKAILNITDGDEIIKIEKKWIEDQDCQDNDNIELDSKSLNFRSFWPLFAFNGVVSTVSLMLFMLHKGQHRRNSTTNREIGSASAGLDPTQDQNEFNSPPSRRYSGWSVIRSRYGPARRGDELEV